MTEGPIGGTSVPGLWGGLREGDVRGLGGPGGFPKGRLPLAQGRTGHGCHQKVVSVGDHASPGTGDAPGLEEARVQTLNTGGLGGRSTTGYVTLRTWLNLSAHPFPGVDTGMSQEPVSWVGGAQRAHRLRG